MNFTPANLETQHLQGCPTLPEIFKEEVETIVRRYFPFIIHCQFITGNWDGYRDKQHFWRNSWIHSELILNWKDKNPSMCLSKIHLYQGAGSEEQCQSVKQQPAWVLDLCGVSVQSTCLQKGSFWLRVGKHGLFWSPSFQDHICSFSVCFSPSVISPFSFFIF